MNRILSILILGVLALIWLPIALASLLFEAAGNIIESIAYWVEDHTNGVQADEPVCECEDTTDAGIPMSLWDTKHFWVCSGGEWKKVSLEEFETHCSGASNELPGV